MSGNDMVGVTVVDSKGNPVVGANVRLWSAHGLLTKYTNDAGYAEIYEAFGTPVLQWQVIADGFTTKRPTRGPIPDVVTLT